MMRIRVSRRHFLCTAVGAGLAAARGLTFGMASRSPAVLPQGPLDCVLVDLEDGCRLRESLAGYEEALSRTHCRFLRVAPDQMPTTPVVIVPGCVRLAPNVAEVLRSSAEAGALVLVESGAAHAEPPEFEAHRVALDLHFGLKVEAPVDLWSDGRGEESALPGHTEGRRAEAGRSHVPYVDYTWPIAVKVRDFSRIVPLRNSVLNGESIGWAQGRPMAARQSFGRGSLVFLGSPLGPALRYGDCEAERWLNALLEAAGGPLPSARRLGKQAARAEECRANSTHLFQNHQPTTSTLAEVS
jgi:hypothetical protein